MADSLNFTVSLYRNKQIYTECPRFSHISFYNIRLSSSVRYFIYTFFFYIRKKKGDLSDSFYMLLRDLFVRHIFYVFISISRDISLHTAAVFICESSGSGTAPSAAKCTRRAREMKGANERFVTSLREFGWGKKIKRDSPKDVIAAAAAAASFEPPATEAAKVLSRRTLEFLRITRDRRGRNFCLRARITRAGKNIDGFIFPWRVELLAESRSRGSGRNGYLEILFVNNLSHCEAKPMDARDANTEIWKDISFGKNK